MSVNDKQVGGEHYRTAIQHWDFVVWHDIPYLPAAALKYVTRAHKKNGVEDLRKGIHFLDKMIEVHREGPNGRVPPATMDFARANELDVLQYTAVDRIMQYLKQPGNPAPLEEAKAVLIALLAAAGDTSEASLPGRVLP